MPRTAGTKNVTTNVEWHEDKSLIKLKLRGRNVPLYSSPKISVQEISGHYNVDKASILNKKQIPGHEAPGSTHQLDFVFGYKGSETRKNIHVLNSKEILYFVAGVAVIQDPFIKSRQRIFNQHTDDIKSMAVHVNGETVATGQVLGLKSDGSQRPAHILIWNSSNLIVIRKLGVDQIFKAPLCLSFTVPDDNGKEWVACVDDHADHRLRIWEWKNTNDIQNKKINQKISQKNSQTPVIETNTTKDKIAGIQFFPGNTGLKRYLIVFGKMLTFYSFGVGKDENKNVIDIISRKRNAVFEGTQKPKIIVSACFLPSGNLITGGSDGLIINWGDSAHKTAATGKSPTPEFMFTAHNGAVFSLFEVPGKFKGHGNTFVSGGKDGLICVWNLDHVQENLSPIESVKVNDPVRCVVTGGESDGFIAGTLMNDIFHIYNNKEMIQKVEPIVVGHTGEVCALDINESIVASGCTDGKLVVRDPRTGEHIWSVKLAEGVKSLAIVPVISNILVGTAGGKIVCFSREGDELFTNKQANDELTSLKIDSSGSLLAAGSRDQCIYLFSYHESKLMKFGVLKGHSSTVLHIDWTLSGSKVLRSQSAAHDIIIWDLDRLHPVSMISEYRGTKWLTESCTFTFNTLGIWEQGLDGTDINECARFDDVLAVADDFGRIRLYQYPCWKSNSSHTKLIGHSSHCVKTRFSPSGQYLATAGGLDSSVILWKNMEIPSWNRTGPQTSETSKFGNYQTDDYERSEPVRKSLPTDTFSDDKQVQEDGQIHDERSLDYDEDHDLINLHLESDDELSQRLRTVDEISRELADVLVNAGR